MSIAKVFPRKTKATPDDSLAFIGEPDLLTPEWFEKVHISVAFTYDLPYAEKLAKVWSERTNELLIGGPGTGQKGEDFVAGKYLKVGYVITSRGCPNDCWFCSVHEREGNIRELPIIEGWNILDDNLLACSENHITNVFQNKYEQLVEAGKILNQCDISKTSLRCYVLCGYNGDTFDKAEKRMMQTIWAGFIPMAMLYRDNKDIYKKDWSKFQKEWTRPAIMRAKGLI